MAHGKASREWEEQARKLWRDGEDVYAAAFMTSVGNLNDWGASCHMTKEKHVLTNFQKLEEPKNVAPGDGRVVKALGSGRVQMNMLFPAAEAKKVWCAARA